MTDPLGSQLEPIRSRNLAPENSGWRLIVKPRYWNDKRYDAKRREHPDYHLWRSRAWRDHIRIEQLKREPFCRLCDEQGLTVPATTVDHIIRPMGNAE